MKNILGNRKLRSKISLQKYSDNVTDLVHGRRDLIPQNVYPYIILDDRNTHYNFYVFKKIFEDFFLETYLNSTF